LRTPYSFRKDALAELPEFDPNRTDYTERELAMYSDMLLRAADKDFNDAHEDCPVLFQEHIEPRWRKEVPVASGTPDATITRSLSKDGHTMYNRQHPQGRKVNSKEQRRDNGASYFR
jgi:hypothetical protein